MSYPPHIPLSERKALCGRLLYYDIAPEHETDFMEEGATGAYASFKDELFDSFDREVRLDKKDTQQIKKPLDRSLQEALERFKETARTKGFHGDYPQLVDALFDKIAERSKGISCKGCSPQSICDGFDTGKDNQIVALKGRCVEQLKQMFDVAREAATIYYSRLGTTFPPGARPDILFSTQIINRPAGSSPAYRVVDGVTTFSDTPAQARAQAQLKIVVDALDLPDYKAMPYVLFHECVAHAFHGIAPRHTTRKVSRRFEHYAEGWMDLVSLKVLEQVARGVGPARKLMRRALRFPDILKVASDFHDQRTKYDPKDYDGTEGNPAHIKYGVEVAKAVFKYIEEQYAANHFKPKNGALKAFFSLSFDLNMSIGFNDDLRDKFIPLMNKLVRPKKDYEAIPELYVKRIAAEELINDYLRTKDVARLLTRLTEIKV